ncbi:unnamed protein product [Urochloa humidicola]
MCVQLSLQTCIPSHLARRSIQEFPTSSTSNSTMMPRSREVIAIDEDPKLWPFLVDFTSVRVGCGGEGRRGPGGGGAVVIVAQRQRGSFPLDLGGRGSGHGEGGAAVRAGGGGERSSSRASDEDEGASARKKLRLSKEQCAFLEESFKEHSTLNPVRIHELQGPSSLLLDLAMSSLWSPARGLPLPSPPHSPASSPTPHSSSPTTRSSPPARA